MTILVRNVLFAASVGFFASLFGAKSFGAEADQTLKLSQYLQRPKLVVVVVIDQFRADYLTRFASRFLAARPTGKTIGGFRYLMGEGAYFPFAQFDVLQNMTCPGHAAILTGALPYAHHIPLNEWYDDSSAKDVYCVEDSSTELVGSNTKTKQPGVSPRLLKVSTFGDELKSAGYNSHIIAISLKDRAAILLGGHRADLAMWFDQDASEWISSRYYLPEGRRPSWMTHLNSEIAKKLFQPTLWKAKGQETGLSNQYDKGKFEREGSYGSKESLRTPVGIELTTQAAIAALKEYKLGSSTATDLLAVSYSSHDMLGHKFGPNAREMEELTIAEDQSLSELFTSINNTVPGGIKNALIVLTGDHGVAPTVPFAMTGRFETGTVNGSELLKNINTALSQKFGPTGEAAAGYVAAVHSFNFYLNHKAIAARKLTVKEVEDALKSLLLKENATEAVFSLSDYRAGRLPGGIHARQINNSYVPGINGDVVLIPKPFYVEEGEPATHMTGYSYDRTVPIVIAGPHILRNVYATQAHVIDIAPTLSFLSGVLPPTNSEGRVLSEAIGK